MEKTVYITEEEREKCRKVIDVFEELYEIEDEDILLVDVGRYGFVKLQCYTASHGFANVIYNLRKKIESDSRKPIYIKTVLGMGYKFASGE